MRGNRRDFSWNTCASALMRDSSNRRSIINMDKQALKKIIEPILDSWMDSDENQAEIIVNALWAEVGLVIECRAAEKAYDETKEAYNGHFKNRNDPSLTREKVREWTAKFDRLRAENDAAMKRYLAARTAMLKAGK